MVRRTSVLVFVVLAGALALSGSMLSGPGTPPTGQETGRIAAAAAGPADPFADWSTFHGSENRSGYTPFAGPLTLQHAWYRCLGAAHLRLGPVLDGSRVYLADDLGTVYALNLTSNESVAWSLDLDGEPVQMDASGGSLIVATATGGLFSLASGNGTILWRLTLGAGVVQGVAVAQGLVLVGTAVGDVIAFSQGTGSEEWSVRVGTRIGGAVAVEGTTAYAVTSVGRVVALTLGGALRWSANLSEPVDTSVAVSDGTLVVGSMTGNLTALSASTGVVEWRWNPRPIGGNDSEEATPAIGDGLVIAAMDSGSVYAVHLANGSFDWSTPSLFSGYPIVTPPALTPSGVYVVENGIEAVEMLAPSNGSVVWADSPGAFVFSPPAVDHGHLLVGLDNGCAEAWGPTGLPPAWPVRGQVVEANGTPAAGAYLSVGLYSNYSDALGRFEFDLPNGSYLLTASLLGFVPASVGVRVQGPVGNLTLVLEPLALFPISGQVVDRLSGRGVHGAVVTVSGAFQYSASVVTGPDGTFSIGSPNGTINVSVASAPGYQPSSVEVLVPGAPVRGVIVRLGPEGLDLSRADPYDLRVLLPLSAIGLATVGFAAWDASRRRVAEGLGPGLLSPFGRFVLMRALLVPAQVLVLLAGLYAVGSVLPAVAGGRTPCSLTAATCAPCPTWGSGCGAGAVLGGFGVFVSRLFTGDWGWASFGSLREPVPQFLSWWLADSVELAAVSVALAVAIGYPLALYAGWRRGSAADPLARVGSMVGLVIPSVVVALALVLLAGTAFYHALGDLPFGSLPSLEWFRSHGGPPSWIGVGSNTGPTGFPLVDGAIHGDWGFELVVLAKTLVQAAIIAVIYLGIFFRHAWSVAAESARAPSVTAARARGVPEATLLWRHTHRRTLPVLVLVLGLTLPAFIGTQALVEALFSDQGLGTILLIEIANLRGEPPGFLGPTTGNFYQVMVFLLAFVLLYSTLFADVLARYLDPRLQRGDP